jgi:hypothetical protein
MAIMQRLPSPASVTRILDLKPWMQVTIDQWKYTTQYGNGQCRFCLRTIYETRHVWKYGVRHYVCNDCREEIKEKAARQPCV